MSWKLLIGDSLEQARTLPDASVHCIVTSPPYWGLRDYGVDGQMGLESTPQEYIERMVPVFNELHRVLRRDGTLWLNIGDTRATAGGSGFQGKNGQRANRRFTQESLRHRRNGDCDPKRGKAAEGAMYRHGSSGLKPKDLVGIPWMLAFALRDAGWYLRQDIIWYKPNVMPQSAKDRCTQAHEYLFLLSKSRRYYYDWYAITEKASPNTHARLSQNLEEQIGSARANGGTRPNRPMRAGSGSAKIGLREHGVAANESFRRSVCVQQLTRNKRSVWRIPTMGFPGAHFATFPVQLATICILAGTSERGCCPACGAPWRRLLKQERVRTRPGAKSKSRNRTTGEILDDGLERPWRDHAEFGNRDPGRHVTAFVSDGWQATCKCEAGDPVPCTVLDSFAGAGTTLVAARRLGRDAVGIELNPEYAADAERRIIDDAPLLNGVHA